MKRRGARESINVLLLGPKGSPVHALRPALAGSRRFLLMTAFDVNELPAILGQCSPLVAYLDTDLLNAHVLTASRRILQANPDAAVIGVGSRIGEGLLFAVFLAGACGFLLAGANQTLIRQSALWGARGFGFIDPRLVRQLLSLLTNSRPLEPLGLTPQEIRVMSLLPSGLSNKEIAVSLGLSEHTVKSHLRSAMRRMGVHTRTEAASFAIRKGYA